MTKKKMYAVIVGCISILLIGTIIVCVLNMPRLYRGDRITGSFTMMINGEEYIPDVQTIKYENDENQPLDKEGNEFSIKGGKYGGYDICFELDNRVLAELSNDPVFKTYPNATTLSFFYVNSNWWNITNIVISVDMTKEIDGWALSTVVKYTEKRENGTQKKDETTTVSKYSGYYSQSVFGL